MIKTAPPLLLIAAPLAASADTRADTTAVHVPWADLDLANPRAVGTLWRRVDAAIRAICPDGPRGELARFLAMQRCWDRQHAQVDPQVRAVIARRTMATQLADQR